MIKTEEMMIDNLKKVGIVSDSPPKLEEGRSEFDPYDDNIKPEIIKYDKQRLTEIVGTGVMPGFRQNVDVDSAVNVFREIGKDYKDSGRPHLGGAYSGLASTIESAKEGKEITPKEMPHPGMVDYILNKLPFDLSPSMTQMNYTSLAASLMYGLHD